MDPENLAQRIAAISVVDSEPERPAGVDPAAVWRVPVGTIYVVDQAELAVVRTANDAHAESPGLLGMEDYLPEPEPEPLACPARVCQPRGIDRAGALGRSRDPHLPVWPPVAAGARCAGVEYAADAAHHLPERCRERYARDVGSGQLYQPTCKTASVRGR